MRGVVVRIPVTRDTGMPLGFLFIRDDQGTEYFMHRTGLQLSAPGFEKIKVGAVMEFTPIEGPKGPRAIEAKPA